MRTNKKRFFSLLAGFLAVLMLLGTFGSGRPNPVKAASSSEIQDQIDELKEKEAELKQQKKDLQNQIKDNMGEMELLVAQKGVLDQEIFLLNEQVTNINQQIQAYGLLIADKQEELEIAQERFQLLTEQHKDRIRAMEMYGEMTYFSVLAQAGSFGELLDRLSMVSEIAASDQRRLQQLQDAALEVADAQAILETEKSALEDTRAQLDAAQQEILAKRAEADALLQQLIAKGDAFDQLLHQAEEDTEKLLEDIAKKEEEYTEAKKAEYEAWLATSVPPTTTRPSYNTNKPSNTVTGGITWTCPISYYICVSSPYGWREHPVLGGQKFHGGVDLAAPQGTAILAARDGVVTAASYSSGNGYYVTINHGDGFSTSYLHMTHYTVSVGQRVSAGQKIGECGSTGISTGPHLHFSIYYNGGTVNPANYIRF